jgi:retron-type reverse transcriptase
MAGCEDKLVQSVLRRVLEAVFEPKFHWRMFGLRLWMGCHNDLKKLNRLVELGKASFIVNADIKGFLF